MTDTLQAAVDKVVRGALDDVFPAAQIEVRHHGRVVLSRAYGWLDPDTRRRPVEAATRFDLASLTKLFVVTAFMTLVEAGRVQLDQPAHTVLPEFGGLRPVRPFEDPLRPGAFIAVAPPGTADVDAGQVTFRHLLAHNAGLPAWRPLYLQPDAESARRLALDTFFAYPTGARVVYSDLGLILLGLAVERLAGRPLGAAVAERVSEPLGLAHTGYRPVGLEYNQTNLGGNRGRQPTGGLRLRVRKRMNEYPFTGTIRSFVPPFVDGRRNPAHTNQSLTPNIAPTEFCAWRGRRLAGEVHDENAARLGGVAGHAGLFAAAADVAALGESYRSSLSGGQGPRLLLPATVGEMLRVQALDGLVHRGLGFALWSPDPDGSAYPFSQRAFGHTGFTGTSLWVDPARGLAVAALTNRVYYGRQPAGILAFRLALHRAIVEAVGG